MTEVASITEESDVPPPSIGDPPRPIDVRDRQPNLDDRGASPIGKSPLGDGHRSGGDPVAGSWEFPGELCASRIKDDSSVKTKDS